MVFHLQALLVYWSVFFYVGVYAKVEGEGKEYFADVVPIRVYGQDTGESNGFVNKPEESSTSIPIEIISSPTKNEYEIVSKQKVAVFSRNVDGYRTVGKSNTIFGRSFKFITQTYAKRFTDECVKLVRVMRLQGDIVLDTVKISCEYEDPDKLRWTHLRFEGVIYEVPTFEVAYVVEGGDCVQKQYLRSQTTQITLSEKECDDLTERTRAQRQSGAIPGTEPISPEDLYYMSTQIVAVMKGSVKGFSPKGRKYKYDSLSKSFKVETQDYEKDEECVKVVSFRRQDHDEDFDKINVPCTVTGPAISNDDDIEFNFGNILYILDRFNAVFVIQDGVCLSRNYVVIKSKVMVSLEKTLSPTDCYMLTRWSLQERRSVAKMNKPPPPKTTEAPGLMWLLALNDQTPGYEPGPVTTYDFHGGLELKSQDFYRAGEECVRVVYLGVYGVVAEHVKVSCGDIVNLHIAGLHMQFGKVFVFAPEKPGRTFKALFNFRERGCILRKYTYISNPKRIFKSIDTRVKNQECKDLAVGRDLLHNLVSADGTPIHKEGLIIIDGPVRIVHRPVYEQSVLGWLKGFVTGFFG